MLLSAPLDLYCAVMVVMHCRPEEVAGIMESFPVELRGELSDWPEDAQSCDGMADCKTIPGDVPTRYLVMYVDATKSAAARRRTVVHESGHLAVYLMKNIDQRIKPGCDEPFCYLLEWLCATGWKACGL